MVNVQIIVEDVVMGLGAVSAIATIISQLSFLPAGVKSFATSVGVDVQFILGLFKRIK